ncbi:hypothetical protein ACH5RR_009763 [Cinchona calisaya]|uniref:Uncharacterized protein n=1 Tax=Cinchona calisaya TaxID=153742 RepID=A0ABD3AH87_9GENT
MMASATHYGFLMMACTFIAVFFLYATHTVASHVVLGYALASVFGGVFVIVEACILLQYDTVRFRSTVSTPLRPASRALLGAIWIALTIGLRSCRETAPQGVIFLSFSTLSVFFTIRLLRPTGLETGFFAFCCASSVGQAFVSFGAKSLATWLMLIIALFLLSIDYTIISQDIASAATQSGIEIQHVADIPPIADTGIEIPHVAEVPCISDSADVGVGVSTDTHTVQTSIQHDTHLHSTPSSSGTVSGSLGFGDDQV